MRVFPDSMPMPIIKSLEAAGYLHAGLIRDWLECECGEKAEIVWLKIPGDTISRPYRCCSECGPEVISPDDLRTWEVDFTKILFAVAAAMDMDIPREDLPGISWSFGRRSRKNIYYLQCPFNEHERMIRKRYEDCPGTVFLVSTAHRAQECEKIYDLPIISITRYISYVDSQICFDKVLFWEKFNETVDTGKTHHVKQKRRLDKIQKLTLFLKDFVVSSLDYIRETSQRGEVDVLPRPTQSFLAKATGMSQQDVSNCLNDLENGKVLNFIWENLLTVEGTERLKALL